MKIAKKILAVLLSVLMIGAMMVVFTACGDDKDDKKAKSSKKSDKSTSDEDKSETDEDEDSEDEESEDEESEDEESEDVIETSKPTNKPSPNSSNVEKAAEKAVASLWDAINNRDSETVVNLVYPKEIQDSLAAQGLGVDYLTELFDSLFEMYDEEYGEGWMFEYDFTGTSVLADSDIQDMIDEYSSTYGVDFAITAAVDVDMDETAVVNGAEVETDSETITTYEYDGQWYVAM